MLYPGLSLWGSYPFAEKQSVYSTASAYLARCNRKDGIFQDFYRQGVTLTRKLEGKLCWELSDRGRFQKMKVRRKKWSDPIHRIDHKIRYHQAILRTQILLALCHHVTISYWSGSVLYKPSSVCTVVMNVRFSSWLKPRWLLYESPKERDLWVRPCLPSVPNMSRSFYMNSLFHQSHMTFTFCFLLSFFFFLLRSFVQKSVHILVFLKAFRYSPSGSAIQ